MLEDTTQKSKDIVVSYSSNNLRRYNSQQKRASILQEPLLAQILSCVKTGWQEELSAGQQPHYKHRRELIIKENYLLKGMHVVIPPDLREKMLNLLHETHPGIVRMKVLARSCVWWPGINKDLEGVTHECEECQQNQKEDQRTLIHLLEQPSKSWQRVHLDFAEPF